MSSFPLDFAFQRSFPLESLFPELKQMIFQILIDQRDIATLIRLRLTCHEYNEWLSEYNFVITRDLSLVVFNGHLDLLKKISHDSVLSNNTMHNAVGSNQVEIVKWLFERGAQFTGVHYKQAAHRGYIELVEWASTLTHSIPVTSRLRVKFKRTKDLNEVWRHNEIALAAIMGGHLNILEWAYQRGLQLYEKMYSAAIFVRDLKILKWLQDHQIEPSQAESGEIQELMSHLRTGV